MLRLLHQVALCNGYMKDVTALVIAQWTQAKAHHLQ